MSIDSEKRIGNIYGFDGGNYAGNVYDSEKLSPTLRANSGGNTQPMIVDRGGDVMNEPMCVASRGRNPDNPSDRTVGAPTEQRLEVNMQGISNCLTSVGKDNMVLQSVKIKQATKNGYIDCEIGGVADLSYPNSETRRGRVQENGTISPTLTAGENDICRIESGYRIRKLTPRECGRLMNVTDEDISKMAAVNSNAQLYKQFGNSIVVSVLMAMFSNLHIQGVKAWEDMSEQERNALVCG